MVYDHPKFGLIPCISTIADIEEGEEVSNISHWRTQSSRPHPASTSPSPLLRSWWVTATTWRSPLSGTRQRGKTVSWNHHYKTAWKYQPKTHPGPDQPLVPGVFGQEGVEYKDWLECTVRKPISGHCGRG